MLDTIQKVLVPESKASADAAMRLIVRVEKEFSFDSGVHVVTALPWAGGWYFNPRPWGIPIDNVSKVPSAGPRSLELKTFVYHELGHALCDHFELKSYLSPFTRRFQRSRSDYAEASNQAAASPRREGFVSGYASCNREEDFCETLSAYLLNRTSWRKSVRYEGDSIDVSRDPKLRAKLEAVHSLLNDLHAFG